MMNEIYETYNWYNSQYEAARKRLNELIAKHRRAIERHQKTLEKVERNHKGWIDQVLTPLANEISERLGGLKYEVYGPFGLSCYTSVHFFPGEGQNICKDENYCLTVFPEWDVDTGAFYLRYDTGERTKQYAVGTIGWMNNMNAVTAPLPDSIEEIMTLVQHHNWKEDEA